MLINYSEVFHQKFNSIIQKISINSRKRLCQKFKQQPAHHAVKQFNPLNPQFSFNAQVVVKLQFGVVRHAENEVTHTDVLTVALKVPRIFMIYYILIYFEIQRF
jgi:hypothetical protein